MKWMLVVLVGGMTPVNTDLVFDKFADCLAAEEQMRKHYTDAFEAWDRWAAANIERRREYSKVRDLQAKRLLSNIGTCVPHAGGDPAALQQQSNPTLFSPRADLWPADDYRCTPQCCPDGPAG
ncbi:MAG: hypothetical protein QOH32_4781 [Bradyrhizobium sp.]|nr:hypothetical protein [Bradyrhizobium sp.]